MKTKKYKRLTLKERVVIETLLQENKTKSYIAKKLNRSRSTITREIKKWGKNYSATLAYWSAKDDDLKENSEIINLKNVQSLITNNEKTTLTNEEYNLLSSVIEGTVRLRNKKDRILSESSELTKGKILTIIQNKQAVFDIEQKKAALNIIDSPQRIRGLAGSGKTIILTMKAALFHLQNPDANILYTYFTKALYGQIKYLIEKYYRDFSENREPDWSKIHIYHGWGGKGLNGVYSDTCSENGIQPIGFFTAKAKDSKDPFNYICKEIEKNKLKEKFDLTLIDEGQDFPMYFYRLCRKITKNNRIVWAYDDFQNIFDVTIQNEKETFGKNEEGDFFIDFQEKKTNFKILLSKNAIETLELDC